MKVVWDGFKAKVERLPVAVLTRIADTERTRNSQEGVHRMTAQAIINGTCREAPMTVAELSTENVAKESAVFHSVLVATDFSEVSGRALSIAARLAAHHHARLSAVHVFQNDWRYEMLDNPPDTELDKVDAHRQLEASIEKLHLSGGIDSILIKHGPVLPGVLSATADSAADLLVISTRGRGGFSKIAVGSVAEELLRLAQCPVLTIGPNANIASGIKCHTILFATDFGPGSAKALPLVLRLRRREQGKLVLLHVIPPMPEASTSVSAYGPGTGAVNDLQEWEAASRQRSLRQLREWTRSQLHAADLEPEYIVGMDFLAEGILTAADQLKADLIAMGANRSVSPRWASHFPWSAAHEIIHGAPCPVMTVAG
jgi:nucleotide-binding universal stress UspA family protein